MDLNQATRPLRRASRRIAPPAWLAPRVLGELVRHLSDRELERRFGTPLVERLVLSAMAGGFDPAAADGFRGTLAFELTRPLTGKQPSHWVIEVESAEARARSGAPRDSDAAALAVRLPVEDFMRIAGGVIDPAEPILAGRANVRGDLGLASRLAEMFGAPALR